MRERLQKILARAGVASRRAAEELITAGRVRVNGKVVSELGAQAHPYDDRIEVDGRHVLAEDLHYVVLHKPREVVSTLSDPEGRPTVADFLRNAGSRMYPVGRLDFATSGVLLATNDGDFANGLLHPRRAVPKTYVVKVRGRMENEDLERWRTGVVLEDGKTLPAQVRRMRFEEERTWIEVTIHEGRNQQIRRMGDATGFFVMRLARVSFAGITSDDLRPGQWRYLTRDELVALRDSYGVPKRTKQVEEPLGPSDLSSRARGRVVQRGDEPTIRRLKGPNAHLIDAVAAAPAPRAPRPGPRGDAPEARVRPGRPPRDQRFEAEAPRGRPPRPDAGAPRGRPARPDAEGPRGRPARPGRPDAEAPRGRPARPGRPDAEAPRGRPVRPGRPDAEAPRGRPQRPDAEAPRGRPQRPGRPDADAPRGRPARPGRPDAEAPRGRPARPGRPDAEAPRGRPARPGRPDAEAPRGRPARPGRPDADAPRGRPQRPDADAPRGRPARPDAEAPRGRPQRPDRPDAEAPRGRPARPEVVTKSPGASRGPAPRGRRRG